MSRGVWVFDKKTSQLIPKHLYHKAEPARSRLPAPMVISDTMEVTMNPADGRRYSSKAAYYKAVRAAGCEIVGNEKQTQRTPEMGDPTPDIIEAMHKVRQGHKPRRKAKHG